MQSLVLDELIVSVLQFFIVSLYNGTYRRNFLIVNYSPPNNSARKYKMSAVREGFRGKFALEDSCDILVKLLMKIKIK